MLDFIKVNNYKIIKESLRELEEISFEYFQNIVRFCNILNPSIQKIKNSLKET